MKPFEIVLLATNLISYCMHDYSERICQSADLMRVSVSFSLELICNIIYIFVFTLKIIANGCFIGSEAYFKSQFNKFNFLIIVSR